MQYITTWKSDILQRSSLIYNTSVRHEQHECNTSVTNATWVRHEWDWNNTSAIRVRHECNMSATRMLHERYECDANATRTTRVRHEWKILILITTRVKTYFHTPIFTTWQVKDYKERNNFILKTFWKWLVSMSKCVGKSTTKTELCTFGSYIKKLYTRL